MSSESVLDPEKLLIELQDKVNENGVLVMQNDDLKEENNNLKSKN